MRSNPSNARRRKGVLTHRLTGARGFQTVRVTRFELATFWTQTTLSGPVKSSENARFPRDYIIGDRLTIIVIQCWLLTWNHGTSVSKNGRFRNEDEVLARGNRPMRRVCCTIGA